MFTQTAIDAEQARANMCTASDGPAEAVQALNDAIREASNKHRGHTVAFLSRSNIDAEDLARIKRHFEKRGFRVDDRCHNRETFAMTISWYPE
ncbi:hypothetical protein [Salinisphaera sp. Q1T1-3]|uniref:hypothetical protein n=1 Tax=Salinisphaera sp. Q1T1-3 TaxID=2321229 RepID=UPI000E734578|nr:hypothetical protein [Salinisphaera sp. Q1T1-3]RJS93073.1 hypothetical protein D3260_09240 [Salinisphaera sp. Q1T1-3]